MACREQRAVGAAEGVVGVELDQDERLASGIVAFAQHGDARNEVECRCSRSNMVVRLADVPRMQHGIWVLSFLLDRADIRLA